MKKPPLFSKPHNGPPYSHGTCKRAFGDWAIAKHSQPIGRWLAERHRIEEAALNIIATIASDHPSNATERDERLQRIRRIALDALEGTSP